jgi:hypothetical protein
MNLLPLFQWFESFGLGGAIRSSSWLFPVIEYFHLAAFAALGGAVLLVDARLLGIGLKSQPVTELARETRPWFVGSLGVMLASGILLFLSESVKCYYSQPFWIKMTALLLAILFSFSVKGHIVANQERIAPFWGRLVGGVSIALWATVAWGGRWIGFSG